MRNQKNVNELITVKEKDARELTDTIVEVEASKELYEVAIHQANYSPQAFRELLNHYMSVLKKHKAIWKSMLVKYVGEENALFYRDMYRFDVYKKVIFLPENEGCELCGN